MLDLQNRADKLVHYVVQTFKSDKKTYVDLVLS